MYCEECQEECKVVSEDVGIGPYEFWGIRGVDIRIIPVSDCCGAMCYEDRVEDDIDDEGNPVYRLFGEVTEVPDYRDYERE